MVNRYVQQLLPAGCRELGLEMGLEQCHLAGLDGCVKLTQKHELVEQGRSGAAWGLTDGRLDRGGRESFLLELVQRLDSGGETLVAFHGRAGSHRPSFELSNHAVCQ